MYQLWKVGGWDGRNMWANGAAHRLQARPINIFELIKRPSQCTCEPRQCRQVGSGGMGGKGRCWWFLGWALHDESSTLQIMKLSCTSLGGLQQDAPVIILVLLMLSWSHSQAISMAPLENAVAIFQGLGNGKYNPWNRGFRCECLFDPSSFRL